MLLVADVNFVNDSCCSCESQPAVTEPVDAPELHDAVKPAACSPTDESDKHPTAEEATGYQLALFAQLVTVHTQVHSRQVESLHFSFFLLLFFQFPHLNGLWRLESMTKIQNFIKDLDPKVLFSFHQFLSIKLLLLLLL